MLLSAELVHTYRVAKWVFGRSHAVEVVCTACRCMVQHLAWRAVQAKHVTVQRQEYSEHHVDVCAGDHG